VTRGDGIKPTAAARATSGRAELAAHAVEQVGDDLVLRGQRTFADARGVSLHHTHDAIHAMRWHARAGASAAGRGVGRSDERIRAVINVEERALRAFEQHLRAGVDGVVQQHDGVRDERFQELRRPGCIRRKLA
jgi:hypothetical protein